MSAHRKKDTKFYRRVRSSVQFLATQILWQPLIAICAVFISIVFLLHSSSCWFNVLKPETHDCLECHWSSLSLSPSLPFSSLHSWLPIISHVESKFEEYLNSESRVLREALEDHRIHCCLYFIPPTGHG